MKLNFDEIFLIEALLWSSRSIDPVTKCGCVIVKDKTLLSAGYNGPIRNVDDNLIPLTRPEKYPFMIHAEHNAILNCTRQGKSTIGATAYITGKPCINCLLYLYQAGIKRILYTNFSLPKMCDEQENLYNFITDKLIECNRPFPPMEINFVPKEKINLKGVVNYFESYLQEQKDG